MQTRKHCCRNILSQCCSQCYMGEQTGRKQNLGANSASSKCVAWVSERENNRKTFKVSVSENIQSQCFFGLSQMILHLCPQATCVEDTKFASWKIISKTPHRSEHEWTRVNTNEHEWTRVEHEWTRVNTSGTRVNTSEHEWNTSEHEWTRVEHEWTWVEHEWNTSEHEWNTNEHEWTRMNTSEH